MWRAVATGAALARVMPVTEVIEYVGAVTIFGVTKLDHFAQLAPLQGSASRYVAGVNAKLGCRHTVEHDDTAGATTRFSFRKRSCGRDARGPRKSGPSCYCSSGPGR